MWCVLRRPLLTSDTVLNMGSSYTPAVNLRSLAGASGQIGADVANTVAATTLTTTVGNVSSANDVVAANNVSSVGMVVANAGIYNKSKSAFVTQADGDWTLLDNANTSFGTLKWGGVTSSFAGIKRVGATLSVRLADDSGPAPILASNIPVADTGWTANADGGDKTAVIPSNATLAAMTAALNVVLAGFGDAFVATADKVKAIETVLVAIKLPNA